ncbi:hypothetical protein BOX15_Mlig013869g1 [Macrostomum lignano]|uniref:Uncharacterized protein n=1 Tax=Macrostomum lignano TaxID=282301 RepID=A0A267H634_9PLAT|nr:hypothetical protein BOX15_Mlig013869g1 [Macrostomum lignano]
MSTGFSSDLMQQLAELDAKISQVYSAGECIAVHYASNLGEPQLLMLNEGVNKLTILRQKLYFVKGKIMRSNQLNVLAYPASDLYMTGGEKESLTDLLRLILDQRFDLDEKLRLPQLAYCLCLFGVNCSSRRLLQFASGFYSHYSPQPDELPLVSMGNLELTFQQLVDGFFGILSTESQVITLRKMKLMYQSIAQLLDKFQLLSLRKLVYLYAQNGVDLKHKEAEGILSQYDLHGIHRLTLCQAMMLFANFVNTTEILHYF